MADRWMDERDREWRERDWRRAEALGRGEADRERLGPARDYEEDRSWAGAAEEDDERYQELRRRRGAYREDAPDYAGRSRIVRGGPQAYRGSDDDARSYRADRDREARRRESRECDPDPGRNYEDYFQRSRVRYGDAARDEGSGDFLQRAGERIGAWFRGEGDEVERRYEAAPGHRGRGPKGYRRPDERISEDVHDRLTDDPWLDATDIEVTVKDGEVTLVGHVDNREAKHRAERLVEDLSGVRHVQNNLRVDPNAAFSGAGRGFGSSALEAEMRRNELATGVGTVAEPKKPS
ncbi:MAG TPA: BON domain-containing protein [Phenylobacterium sp.]|uniref:BON domain-containing protein n=1 Tax=Phenylobacterium sp. TaxID=1871053 RepID=UPI002B45F112|nr:BON domain-containing protein [Phenylobacterium sp.]HKR86873.1 BON domain-containing protein [Phenylobacterium sp.]